METPTLTTATGSVLPRMKTPRWFRILSWCMLLLLIALPFILLFVPWTQVAHGDGRAIAFNPVERPQFIISPIEGRIKKWHVVEGDKVKAGERIVELVDNDPNLELRLLDEERAIVERIRAIEGRKLEVERRIANLKTSRDSALTIQNGILRLERERLQNVEQQEVEAQSILDLAEPNFKRQKELLENKTGGLASRRDYEVAEQTFIAAQARLKQAKRQVAMGTQSVDIAKESINKIDVDTAASINSENALLESTKADLASIVREKVQIQVRIARQRAQYVDAPCDGTIWRLLANAEQGAAYIRPGERLAILVPDIRNHTSRIAPAKEILLSQLGSYIAEAAMPSMPGMELAMAYPLAMAMANEWPLTDEKHTGIVAELLMDGNDLPLIRKGDTVRLQFEGWPAVQFVGWPSVAIGTFGGRVLLVDPTANEKGQFRILVEADPNEIPWPDENYLRQGVRTQGWVLLARVSIGWEIWRQINGFPPMREAAPPPKSTKPMGPVQRR